MRQWRVFVAALVILFATGNALRASVKLAPAAIGLSGARAGRWISGLSAASNSGEKLKKVRIGFQIKNEPGLEFQRTVGVPAHGLIRFGFPVLCPTGIKKAGIVFINSWRIGAGEGRKYSGGLFVDHSRMPTAAIFDSSDHGTASRISGMRTQIGFRPQLGYAATSNLPFELAGYDGLFGLALSIKRPKLAPSQILALRQWLVSGGHLWIQAQHTPQSFCRALLGGAWRCTVVGRGRVATLHFTAQNVKRTMRLGHAISLAYLWVGSMRVLERVNGWPAVATCRVGEGKLFVSAINGHAMLNAKGKPGSVLWPISQQFFKTGKPLNIASVATLARGHIGYRIESRPIVAAVLVGLTMLLIVGAIWATRRGRMELSVLALLGGVIVAGGLLFLFGRLQRGRVPQTCSVAQVMEIFPNQHLMLVRGVCANFSPYQVKTSLAFHAGALPQSQGVLARQKLLKIHCASDGALNLQDLRLASGSLLTLHYQAVMPERQLAVVHGHFGPGGLEIDSGPLKADRMGNVVVAAPAGMLAVRGLPASRMKFGDSSILPHGEYLAAGLLTASLASIGKVYHAIVLRGVRTPHIFCQTDHWTAPLTPGGSPQRYTQSVVDLPIELKPPAAGKKVHIPWPFLPFDLIKGPGQQAASTVYESNRHEWIQHISHSSHIYIRYQLPAVENHLRVTSGVLHLNLSAPGRPVTIMVRRKGVWRAVKTIESPAGRMLFRLGARHSPLVGGNGGLAVGIYIGGKNLRATAWEMHSVRLSVSGSQP